MANENKVETEVIVNVSVGNTQSLDNALKEVKDDLKQIGATDITPKSTATFKQQLREATQQLNTMLAAGEANTQEFRDMARRVAELRDAQQEANTMVEAFDPDNKFKAFVGIAKGAASAVQGYTGALAFLGVEGGNAAETMARLQGIMAFTDAIGGIADARDSFKGFVSLIKGSIGTMKASELAAKGFGLALKGLGIGLIVSAIAYLVTNFDELKESFSDILPEGINLGKVFDTLKNIIMGVGSVIINHIVQPIKAVIALLKGDFKKAMEEFKKGADVIGNFNEGFEKSRAAQEREAAKERAKKDLEDSELRLKLLRKSSKEYLAEENKAADLRIMAAANAEETKKAIQDRAVLYADRRNKALDEADQKAEEAQRKREEQGKAAAEKIAAERKAGLEELRKINIEANDEITAANNTARDKELNSERFKYEKRVELARKFNQDTAAITEAFRVAQERINDKYDKAIFDALNERQTKNAGVYVDKQKEINKFYDGLLLTATDKQRQLIEINRQNELIAAGRQNELANSAADAANALTLKTATNQSDDRDAPQQAYDKQKAILDAEQEAEDTAFALKLDQLQGNNAEIENVQAAHTARLIEIEKGRVAATKALAEAEARAKVDALGVAAEAASSFSDLAGDQTVAGKALAIASATIATYLAATQAYASASAIPIYGQIAGPLAAAAAIAAGLNNIRNIVKVQVPGKGSGGGTVPNTALPSSSNVTAPQVNSSLANGTNGVQDVRVTNPEDQVIKAYITDQDLQDNQQRNQFLNLLSTI
jgi:hypothetical protein